MPTGEESEVDRSEGGPKRQKEREERTRRGPGAGLGCDRPGWPGPPSYASTSTLEADHRRGKFGSRKERIKAASLLGGGIPSGDHVRPTTSRGLNLEDWAAQPVTERVGAVTK